MCLVFTCGEHTFQSTLEGYEGVTCECHRCHNYSGQVTKSKPWFTFCFIPMVPLSIRGYEEVTCHICNSAQPLNLRPDVQSMKREVVRDGVPLEQQGPPQNVTWVQPTPPQRAWTQPPPQQAWTQQPPTEQQPQGWNEQPANQNMMRYG
ncbi:hypothetical protein F5883DRAFT_77765 [Diaporthe sp. PMI_573]|nr:hypothetical protein F5883DRAFT_77765 [Diaporthaceae sp. PMI_573]